MIWIKANKQAINISEMSISHLNNTIKYIDNKERIGINKQAQKSKKEMIKELNKRDTKLYKLLNN